MKNRKNIISKKFLLKIKPDLIIFDLFLFVYSEFILYSIIPDDMKLYQLFTLNWLVFMGIVITFFISWYGGYLFSGFMSRINERFIGIATLISLWIPGSMFLFIAWNLESLSIDGLSKGQVYWSYFGVIIGLLAGSIFGLTEQMAEKGKSVLQYRVQGMMIPSSLCFFYLGFSPSIEVPAFIFFAMGMVSYLLCFKIGDMLDNNEERHLSRAYKIFRRWVFPFIIVMIFCLWEELYIWGKIQGALMKNKTVPVTEMLFYLTVSGIIPVRIIMVLRPPFTFFGLFTGTAAMGYFIYSVSALVNRIF